MWEKATIGRNGLEKISRTKNIQHQASRAKPAIIEGAESISGNQFHFIWALGAKEFYFFTSFG